MATSSTRKSTRKAVQSPAGANGSAGAVHAPAPETKATVVKAARAARAPKATKASGATGETKATAPTGKPRAKPRRPAESEPLSVAVEQKTKRAKKEKVVRDSFTMPKSDYEKIDALKQKCLDAGVAVKKSELLRAGLLLLEGISVDRLLDAIAAVETVKTGRPAKHSEQDAVH
ncbi:hypothetical protein [Paraburkholderia phenazinium]|uniref:Uncharacterized protein n=1 Tax=Paraburkholderia phenazinium TaxID=60549 RepID=A0A1G7Q9Z4_9BURK|nr:hypothetical protein [Paraburkholderia phenazinium]SDF94749.1 hypothetical protein SAMN05216466_101655 [Paraburkholderia phenazinium]